MISFVVFVFGLAVGSFLNCVIYRIGRDAVSAPVAGEVTSPLRGRSYCPLCRHTLSWRDLIPVLSFFILRGKCRYCGKKISLQYPLVEITTGLLFLLIFSPFGRSPVGGNFEFDSSAVILSVAKNPVAFLFTMGFLASLGMTIFLFIIACFLIIIFVYDLKHYIIPDRIIYPAILIVSAFRIWDLLRLCRESSIISGFRISNFEFRILKPILNPFTAAIIASAFFLAIVLFSRGKWMGIGDIKLAFLIGLFLGFPNILVALFFAFLIGAIIGIGLVLAKKKTLKSEVPFGPFLVTGTFIALFWGKEIIQWYLNLFI